MLSWPEMAYDDERALSMEKTVCYPGPTWRTPAQPHDAGWSAEQLQQAERYAHSIDSVAVMVISRGAVIAAWGETARPFNVRSIRKSMLSALYGIHMDAGHIRLSQTLDELGIDDQDPTLMANEKRATVADLLTSRSGVYHPSNCQSQAERDRLPPRGSHAPGTFWHYNNWDFNALDTIFEQCAHARIFDEFEQRIAQPLQMEDFDARLGLISGAPHSIHPAHQFRISARDLARFGVLYLNHGRWGTRQIVPQQWVTDSTRARARTPDGAGYGYMWWVAVEGDSPLSPQVTLPDGAFAALGVGGQLLLVIPSRDMVVAHLTNPDEPGYRPVSPHPDQIAQLLNLILAAQGTM